MEEKSKYPDHSHAWQQVWDRPMELDEKSLDPFTVARMTDHNVKGGDTRPTKENEAAEGKLEEEKPEEAQKDAA